MTNRIRGHGKSKFLQCSLVNYDSIITIINNITGITNITYSEALSELAGQIGAITTGNIDTEVNNTLTVLGF